jgi:hypothetical protein
MFITAFGVFVGICAIGAFALPNTHEVGGIFVLSIAVLTLTCYLGTAVAGGIGLLQGKEWGRIVSIIHAALSVFWIPIGTVIGILTLIYLTKSDIQAYFEGIH